MLDRCSVRVAWFLLATVLLQQHSRCSAAASSNILVVGSVNADTFLNVKRLPVEGENLTLHPANAVPIVDVPGGKGCTQAVAAANLLSTTKETSSSSRSTVFFVGQFGNDAAAMCLQEALHQARVDASQSTVHDTLPSGRGYVFRTESGQVSAVVSGGSNAHGWKEWEQAWDELSSAEQPDAAENNIVVQCIHHLLVENNILYILLQREVPESVNCLVATCAKKLCSDNRNILVIQDVGGQDRPMSREHLQCCDYIVPNETEILRLVASFDEDPTGQGEPSTRQDKKPSLQDLENDQVVVDLAKRLQSFGARNVLITRGRHGSTLVREGSGQVYHQPAFAVSKVVDETGAGDCFRAAFCVALMEGKSSPSSIQQALEFASAAGACSVERLGAVPSAPSRQEVEAKLDHTTSRSVLSIPRGDGLGTRGGSGSSGSIDSDGKFPFLIGSRLNSMKDRPELWGLSLNDPRDFVRRQASVQGLTCVDFNYPQHFHSWSVQEAKHELDAHGLVAGAVCLRYPAKFARGAMNHPDPVLRREAIDLTKEAARAALELGCREVVVWSAFDGYDYPFQVDYDAKWNELIEAFRECCDTFPEIRFSLEFKPTDENTRFFTVPSTGAALLFAHEVDRSNFGLTLDVGHCLMAGENPGQSVAMVGRAKKLFGIQLNDGYTRLAAEDGLLFGSVHPSMALEVMYQLHRVGFDGHLYFDTFPQRTDPVKEAVYNIARVKAFWAAAVAVSTERLDQVHREHDAIGALQTVDEVLRGT